MNPVHTAVCCALVWILAGIGAAQAAAVTLSWYRNQEPDIAGYRIYYGPRPAEYTGSVTVYDSANSPLIRSYTLDGLSSGTLYYFSLRAFDRAGQYSAYSAPCNIIVPETQASPVTPPAPAPKIPDPSLFGGGVRQGPGGADTRLPDAYSAVSAMGADLPAPLWQEAYAYPDVLEPVARSTPELCRPFAASDRTWTTMNLQVAFPLISSPVDIYLGISSDRIGHDALFLITQEKGIQAASDGFSPWLAHTRGPVAASLFGEIDTSALPSGTYRLYAAILPAGAVTLDRFYLWSTDFVLP